MYNFKEIAEKVLKGELSGTFIILSKFPNTTYTLPSSSLRRTNEVELGEYSLSCDGIQPYIHNTAGLCDLYNDGVSVHGNYKVINFITYKDMKQERNVTLTLNKAKEWYKKGGELKEVALQAFKEEELKDNKPRSWEEYCFQRSESKEKGFYINEDSGIESSKWPDTWIKGFNYWRNVLPSKELAEAFLAMMQLMSLRQAWIGNWEADWNNNDYKFVINCYRRMIGYDKVSSTSHPLSFPTEKMAEDFMNCFKDLLNTARPLI